MPPPATPPWWWTGLFAPLLAPLLTGAFGVLATYAAVRFDMRKTANAELTRRRLAIYDEVAPKLNDLLCFFCLIGGWRDIAPTLALQRKRELDRIVHVWGPLFSPQTVRTYQSFIHGCFRTHTGPGRNAELRADISRHRLGWGAEWQPGWAEHYISDAAFLPAATVTENYRRLIRQLAAEIGAPTR